MTGLTFAQENPLEQLEFYMGTWSIPEDEPFIVKNPKYKDLKVIDFEWGSEKRVIHSRTGIYAKNDTIMFSEGIITYNPTTNKLMWLEFQIDGNMLFEGEYRILDGNTVQREYTVHYPVGDKTIPHPEVAGWTRLYRETFIRTSDNSIDWITKTFINGKWIPGSSGGDAKAVRDK
ncbi:MAG: hypothetical protein Aureis2KO_00490 [Aureisphaera sp.]